MNTSSQPLVSVIIPAYNAASTLEETLQSVLASDYTSIEVVVVDDGSSDSTLALAREVAATDLRVRCFTQPNGGVSKARNHALREAKGKYILPLDADDLIGPHFIAEAVKVLEEDTDGEIKGVFCKARFFGAKEGEWKLSPFSRPLIARRNMLPVTALYRKADAERFGGYSEDVVAREDWEFWISMLKDGGSVRVLPECALSYRVVNGGKHVRDRLLKRHVINVLNARHADFFQRELGGPLRYHRSWSKVLNAIPYEKVKIVTDDSYSDCKEFVASLPWVFELNPKLARHLAGTVIVKGRNELRQFNVNGKELVVKSFQIPNPINRIAYGLFRSSKARRSFEYALFLNNNGFHSPEPVAFLERRRFGLLADSYYVCLRSCCRYSYSDLMKGNVARSEEVLREIGRLTARIHDNGFIHKDYSRGNILFDFFIEGCSEPCDDGKNIRLEIIDLNRIRFHKVSIEEGCGNFDRLPGTPQMASIVAEAYCRERGYEGETKEKAIRLITDAMVSAS